MQGGADELRVQRHFSFSDRIRYYWARPEAQAAVDRLFARLGSASFPRLSSANISARSIPRWRTAP